MPSTRCLREGNSDRRAPASVKQYARNKSSPHGGLVGRLGPPGVASMSGGDFRSNERSTTITAGDTLQIVFEEAGGATSTLAEVPVAAC